LRLLTWPADGGARGLRWVKTRARVPKASGKKNKRMRGARSGFTWAMAGVVPLLLAACASMPKDASLPVDDPHEQTNRHVMAMNQEVLRPAATVIKTATPGPVHDRLHDLNSNLKEPRIFMNNILQGRPEAAVKTSVRFAVNSFFGIAGLFDVASRAGIPQQSGDFGQTLFVWGVPEGSYVVVPYLGPATTRDAVGSVVDMVTNPVSLALGPATSVVLGPATTVPATTINVGSAGLDAADRLGDLKMAEDVSIDFYSFIRASYYQMRRAELRDALGLPPAVDTLALEDPDAEPAKTAEPAPGKARLASAPAAKRAASAPNTKRAASPPATKRAASAPWPRATGTPPRDPISPAPPSAALSFQ
jgi:phospholipid-binding lipoprotein MlaA